MIVDLINPFRALNRAYASDPKCVLITLICACGKGLGRDCIGCIRMEGEGGSWWDKGGRGLVEGGEGKRQCKLQSGAFRPLSPGQKLLKHRARKEVKSIWNHRYFVWMEICIVN